MSSYKWKIKYLKDYLYLTWDSWQMLQMETVYVYIFYIWYKWRPKSSSSLTALNKTHKMFWSTVKQWFMKLMIMMIINGQAVSEMNKVLKFFFFLSSYVHELFQTQNSSVMSSSWPQYTSLELYIILWHQRRVRDLMEGTGEWITAYQAHWRITCQSSTGSGHRSVKSSARVRAWIRQRNQNTVEKDNVCHELQALRHIFLYTLTKRDTK